MNRREFSRISALGFGAAAIPGLAGGAGPAFAKGQGGVSGVPDGQALRTESRGSWFKQARFGMFISYSVYSILGQGSWAVYLNQIPVHQYKKLMQQFNPTEFSARDWVQIAKDAGQRYITLIAKHRDGFSMYDTKLSDFSIMHTPFGRDLFGEVAQECHQQGVTFNAYYQLRDWTNPAYRQSFKPGTPLSKEYVDFVHGQVRELCSNYGPLGAVWFDGGSDHTPEQWHAHELIAMIRQLQSDALVDDRTGLPGDFSTPEEAAGHFLPPKPGRLWERCMTMNDHWGYDSSGQRYKDPDQIIQLLVRTVAGGGNLLLNVGPEPTGKIDPTSTANLRKAGEWLKRNGESIYGAESFAPVYYDNVYTTRKGDRIYLHVFDWPPGAMCDFWFHPIGHVRRAYFLETGKPVRPTYSPLGLRLRVHNANAVPSPDTVIAFEGCERWKPPNVLSVPT
ncbi:MAG TPA: alpha-L-fucosidase [Terriglobia bacterium]|nr:alpha-L-fucosidase [Terriglobia bacterium]